MRALVVYESMYGNTHHVADAIADGLGGPGVATVVPVGQASRELVDAADLLVVGGPTHVHGMISERSRHAAVEALKEPDNDLELDPDAEGPGLRDWFDDLGDAAHRRAAAYDTRIDMAPALTGRASKGIAKRLRHRGYELAAEPESFLVSKQSHLLDGEADRARAWGRALAATLHETSTA